MIDRLITDTIVVTMNPAREVLYHAAVAIDKGRILEVGDSEALCMRYPDVKHMISGEGKAVFPGLINTHNHLFQTNLKGMGDDKVLKDWLNDMTYPVGGKLQPEDCYTGALIGWPAARSFRATRTYWVALGISAGSAVARLSMPPM